MTIPPTTTLEGPMAALREKAIEIIDDVALALTSDGEPQQQDVKKLRDMANDLRNMFFMVVVIGEFNAGKSSFVNALVGEKLLPMGITPTTEFIELIRYAEEIDRNPTVSDNSLREWAHPNTGAPGVAIVDTPGTGSVFQKHETVAKEFLHRSDLVIFLLSAKRAFADTERLYLELAKNYNKKIILVINQIDLLKPNEQAEVRRFIENQVKDTLDFEPLIFMVSAKEALDNIVNETNSDPGNIGAVKAHLRGVYAEAPVAKQKLLSQLDTVLGLIQSHQKNLKENRDVVSSDIVKVKDVQSELEQQSLGLEQQMKSASAEIDTVLESVRSRGINFIETNLTVRKLGRGVDKNKLQDEFQEMVIGRSLRDINDTAEGYINAVVDQSRLYWRGVIERLNRLQDMMEQEASGLDSSIYAEQREALQNAIRIAESELKSYSSGEVVNELKRTFDDNMSSFQVSLLASLSGIVALIAAVLAPGPLIGGAPFALPIAVVGGAIAIIAGVPAVMYVRRVSRDAKQQFNTRIDTLIRNYHQALDELTKKERKRLTEYGNQVLTPVFSRLEVLSLRYAEQQNKLERYQREVVDLRGRIEDIVS
ncbi:MAG: dynamin family protein [Anaerolineae bacterium]